VLAWLRTHGAGHRQRLFFGLLVGSFLNVVILRTAAGGWSGSGEREAARCSDRSASGTPKTAPPGMVVDRSRCPTCGHQAAWYENIPVLSYAGAARHAAAPARRRFPGSIRWWNCITGVLFALVVWRFGLGYQSLALLASRALLIAMSGIDLRTTLLPDTSPCRCSGSGCFAEPVRYSPRRRRQSRRGSATSACGRCTGLQAAHRQGRHGLRRLQAAGRDSVPSSDRKG
jgi:prepilin signal peptidase PulO-like enzyme (type II secretory pathway)